MAKIVVLKNSLKSTETFLSSDKISLSQMNSIRAGFCINFYEGPHRPIDTHCGLLIGGSNLCIRKTTNT